MKAVLSESIRLLRNRWFYLSAIVTVLVLWMDLCPHMDMLQGSKKDEIVHLLADILSGKGNLLSLPLLSVLPCAAGVCQEVNTGVARYAIFYGGYRRYVLSKVTALLLSALLSQLVGVTIFSGTVSWIAGFFALAPAPLIMQRLLLASCFAMLGYISALLTGDAVSAYVMPLVFVFTLSMFRSRFFFGAAYMDPVMWLSAKGLAIPLVFTAFLLLTALSLLLTGWEVRRHA